MQKRKKTQNITFVLLGIMGDLSRRKLLPALYQLEVAGLLSEDISVVGVARERLQPDTFVELVTQALSQHVSEPVQAAAVKRLLARMQYVALDLHEVKAYAALKQALGSCHTAIYYCAIPSSVYAAVCQGLAAHGLIRPQSRLVIEKPIGADLVSAQAINASISDFFTEQQTYRIDHYLGKETVQNLICLRFANPILAHLWDNRCIEHVQITLAEAVGVENRGNYFDQAGQMRDMVQNHLLQILTLFAMDPPVDLQADHIRDEKVKVMKALRPMSAHDLSANAVLGQYQAGVIENQPCAGYLEDVQQPSSRTDTFVALKLFIDNWRWAGVPFYVRSGKRMQQKRTEIVIYFKESPCNLYRNVMDTLPQNKLTIRLQPDEGIDIQMLNKVAGLDDQFQLAASKLDMRLNQSEYRPSPRVADAYERLILEVIKGHQALFVRKDEIEIAWQWIDQIMAAWQQSQHPPKPYPAGSSGPLAASTLLAQDGRAWHE
ncbi:MAG: glucose-6-phosphate dehydrogenase [Shewanellaceae bacterium]|nr:glucose-6-phosphate dehydrogenase [Shewanellaceae bacterium]